MPRNLQSPTLAPTGNPARQRILVYRFGQIGDTVAALPALWVLRNHFPEAEIALLSEIPGKSSHLPPETVLPPVGLVDRYEKYPAGGTIKNLAATWSCFRRLRREGFETLVYLIPSKRLPSSRRRDWLFFKLAGIKHIWATKGFEDSEPKLDDGSLTRLPKEADALLQRLKIDGFSIPSTNRGCMDMALTQVERERARAWWQRNSPDFTPPKTWMAVCLGGKTPAQLWPWERYAEVVKMLVERHALFPVIIGGPGDVDLGNKLLGIWGTGLSAAGELTVRESCALMEIAQFYLGNDTGVMHLAAATGIPCVGVFSARNWPGIWEPYGLGHRVLRFDVPCSGCHLSVCDQDLQCLKNISVQKVYDACLSVLANETVKI